MENPFEHNHKRRVWQKGPPLGSQALKIYVGSNRVKWLHTTTFLLAGQIKSVISRSMHTLEHILNSISYSISVTLFHSTLFHTLAFLCPKLLSVELLIWNEKTIWDQFWIKYEGCYRWKKDFLSLSYKNLLKNTIQFWHD